jgi:Planctomycete cytochrome C.
MQAGQGTFHRAVFGVCFGVAVVATSMISTAGAAEQVSYKLDVEPILVTRCGACHTPPEGQGYVASGLDLSSYEGLMKGTKHGAIVVPGDPLRSNLLVLIEGKAAPEIRMPHNQRPLLKYQISTLRDWIKQGAKDN